MNSSCIDLCQDIKKMLPYIYTQSRTKNRHTVKILIRFYIIVIFNYYSLSNSV